MLKIKGWSQAHDEADIEVIETVARHQDPTNNSNKYRRFISVWAPGETPHMFTHTGRWTVECDRGQWNRVGTFRSGSVMRRSTWIRACNNHSGSAHMSAHEAYVQSKLGQYTITRAAQVAVTTNANVQEWLDKGQAVESRNGAATPVPTPTPTPTPAPAPTPTPDRLPDSSPLMARVQNALQRSAAVGTDPFDVMADVATLRSEIAAAITELQGMATDLHLANTNAMERL